MCERCLMLRPRMQTSSPLAGRGAGTPCMTSCRVPLIPRDVNCRSPCHCPSCTLMQEGEMETTLKTARAPLPRPTGKRSRGTVNPTHIPTSGQRMEKWIPVTTVTNLRVQNELVAEG